MLTGMIHVHLVSSHAITIQPIKVSHGCGGITILPIAARAGDDAKRVIIQAYKGSRGPTRLLSPLVMHTGERHEKDADTHTAVAQSILRDGAALPLSASPPKSIGLRTKG